MGKKLSRKFFLQPTLKVAQDLLGKHLVRQIGKKKIIGKIVETEAYVGPQDRASHAFGGKRTLRNRAEYLTGGHIYIYLVYGMYWQLNISTGPEGKPECVLIRALEPANSLIYTNMATNFTNIRDIRAQIRVNSRVASGPGKLCRWMKLDKSFYGEDLTKSKRIWLEDRDEKIPRPKIIASKRIGIDYAGKYWANKKWRFCVKK